MNRVVFDAVTAEAAKRGITAAHFVETLVRVAIPNLPDTHHMSMFDVEKAIRGRAKGLIRARPRQPSAHELAELRIEIAATVKRPSDWRNCLATRQSYERKVSVKFAAELRRRNWLVPGREGYAAGNWSAA